MNILTVDIERVHNIERELGVINNKVDNTHSLMVSLTETIAKQTEILQSYYLLSQSYEELRQDYKITKEDYYNKKEADIDLKGRVKGATWIFAIAFTIIQSLVVYIAATSIDSINTNTAKIAPLGSVVVKLK